MSQSNSSHFHNGKSARRAGKSCTITDGRMSGKSRLEWYEGWNVQDAYLRGHPDPELVTQNDTFFADLRAELRGARA